MNIVKYLIISPGKKNWSPNVKLSNSLKTTMPANAVALRLNLQVPDSMFKKPMLEASIVVREEDVSKPVINAKTLDNIKEVLHQKVGVDLEINVVQKKEK